MEGVRAAEEKFKGHKKCKGLKSQKSTENVLKRINIKKYKANSKCWQFLRAIKQRPDTNAILLGSNGYKERGRIYGKLKVFITSLLNP